MTDRHAGGAPHARPHSRLALTAAALALAVGIAAALSGLGSRWGLWHFGTGFTILRWAARAAIPVGLLSVAALFVTRPGGPRRGFVPAFAALVISLLAVSLPLQWQRTARSVPPIHDITTDTENPPQFEAILPLRADARNPVEYGGPEIARQQRRAYPDIQPLPLDMPPQQAFEHALQAAREMGWEIVAADPSAGRIEATDQTFWFGFKDDVVIRLTPSSAGTILDIRSLSRVGGSDVGTNAKRIREYLSRVQP